MEVKTITGEIQNIKSNRKSFTINNEWFNNYTLLPEDLEKGQEWEVSYIVKEVDNKKFNNIKKLTPIITEKEVLLDKLIPYQVADTILMNVKDIIISDINRGTDFTDQEMTDLIKKLTCDFVGAYKLIK